MLRQMTTFVVTTKKIDACGIIYLESKEVKITFEGKVATVHVITKKEKFAGGWFTTGNFKEFHQVVKLSMNISANYNVNK